MLAPARRDDHAQAVPVSADPRVRAHSCPVLFARPVLLTTPVRFCSHRDSGSVEAGSFEVVGNGFLVNLWTCSTTSTNGGTVSTYNAESPIGRLQTSWVAKAGTNDFRTATGWVTVTNVAVNDAPLVTVPGAQTISEDSNPLLTNITGADVDGGAPVGFHLRMDIRKFTRGRTRARCPCQPTTAACAKTSARPTIPTRLGCRRALRPANDWLCQVARSIHGR